MFHSGVEGIQICLSVNVMDSLRVSAQDAPHPLLGRPKQQLHEAGSRADAAAAMAHIVKEGPVMLYSPSSRSSGTRPRV
eukprot:27602-Eustigmatos_ZCMA.PRE.1